MSLDAFLTQITCAAQIGCELVDCRDDSACHWHITQVARLQIIVLHIDDDEGCLGCLQLVEGMRASDPRHDTCYHFLGHGKFVHWLLLVYPEHQLSLSLAGLAVVSNAGHLITMFPAGCR